MNIIPKNVISKMYTLLFPPPYTLMMNPTEEGSSDSTNHELLVDVVNHSCHDYLEEHTWNYIYSIKYNVKHLTSVHCSRQ